MNCTRCGAELVEHERTREWLPYFECPECCRTFERVVRRYRAPSASGSWYLRTVVTLEHGRTRNARPWSSPTPRRLSFCQELLRLWWSKKPRA